MANYMGTITAFGCIAEHLGHSFSGEIHHLLGLALGVRDGETVGYDYKLQELRPDELEGFFARRAFRGINVTIPYKQVIMPMLDELTDEARAIGAVNTVVKRDGRLIGHNTDFFGMQYLLALAGIALKDQKVLIFGTGGTSHTARAVCRAGGAREVLIFSRAAGKGYLGYDELRAHTDASVIINTTPVGMYPHDEGDPLPAGLSPEDFPRLCGVADAIYHPLRTELVSAALSRGIAATGGLPMLVAQAAAATERFLDITVSPDVIREVTAAVQAQKENTVLIGMPGCGKSTLGRLLAARAGCPLIDTDEEFTAATGKTPAVYIREMGEAAFREAEAAVIRDRIAPLSGVVIATGGGAVLRDDNVRRLKRNGRLVFVDRSLASLEAAVGEGDRPLSADVALLRQRYAERYDRYRAVADVCLTIPDGETPKASAVRI